MKHLTLCKITTGRLFLGDQQYPMWQITDKAYLVFIKHQSAYIADKFLWCG